MPRNISTAMQTLASGPVFPAAIFAIIPWQGSTQYMWSGVGSMTWAGNTFTGIGQLGSISQISEVSSVNATGVSLTLSGIDPTNLQNGLTQLNQGNIAQVYLGAVVNGAVVDSPVLIYQGLTDQVTVVPGADTASITLALESRLSDLQRSMPLKYTAQWQEQRYPGDVCLNAVEKLIDVQLFWH